MAVIARRECSEHGPDTGVVFTERGVTRCGHGEGRACGRELVTVEYVPASQLQGAVKTLEWIASAMPDEAEGVRPLDDLLDRIQDEARATLDRLRGQ